MPTVLEEGGFTLFAGDPLLVAALVETKGEKVRILGNNRIADLLDNAFFEGKIEVFGFSPYEEPFHFGDREVASAGDD